MGTIGVLLISYLVTGTFLVVYDFNCPAYNAKPYVIKRDYKMAFIKNFIWPCCSFLDIWLNIRSHKTKKAFRLGIAISFLFIGNFMWGMVIYLITKRLIGIGVIDWVLNAIAMYFISPILGAFLLPDQNPNRVNINDIFK